MGKLPEGALLEYLAGEKKKPQHFRMLIFKIRFELTFIIEQYGVISALVKRVAWLTMEGKKSKSRSRTAKRLRVRDNICTDRDNLTAQRYVGSRYSVNSLIMYTGRLYTHTHTHTYTYTHRPFSIRRNQTTGKFQRLSFKTVTTARRFYSVRHADCRRRHLPHSIHLN